MRRLGIPLLILLAAMVCAGSASAQAPQSLQDTLGFFPDTIKALPDSLVDIPIWLSNDSVVSAISMLFTFNSDLLWPIMAFDVSYQDLLDSQAVDPGFPVPDSVDWTGPGNQNDSGLWFIDVVRTSTIAPYWDPSKGPILSPYNLNDRGDGKFLMLPDAFGIDVQSIPGGLGPGGGGVVVANLKFRVNPNATVNSLSNLNLVIQDLEDFQFTELSQEWFDPTSVDTIFDTAWVCDSFDVDLNCVDSSVQFIDTLVNSSTRTVARLPIFRNAIFKVDTADSVIEPPPDGNVRPVITVSGNTFYEINVGEQVTFGVSATDAEGGELIIRANGGSLPANANFGTGGVVIGGGGSAAGTFSFVPDINQQSTYVFTFEAVDDSGATSITAPTVTVSVNPLEVDVLFTTSADNIDPQGGIPGLDEVLVPINIITEKTIYGLQYDLTYDAQHFTLDSIIPSDRIPDWIIYENIGANPGEVKVVALGLSNDPMQVGTTSSVMYLAFTVDEFASPGCSDIDLQNALESVDPNPEIPAFELQTSPGVLCVDLIGDVNLNGIIEVDDMTGVVGYIIGNFPLSRRRFATADIVPNDTVNVIDLVGILNTIFGWPVSPAGQPVPVLNDQFATLRVLNQEIPLAGMAAEVSVEAELPTEIAGVEMEIHYNPDAVEMLPPQLTGEADGFFIRVNDNHNGLMKVLLYSPKPWDDDEILNSGIGDIVKLPIISKRPIGANDGRIIRVTKAFMATGDAKAVAVEGIDPGGVPLPNSFELYQNRPNPFNPVTTISFSIDASDQLSEQVTLEVFNIIGQKVKTLVDETLPTGFYEYVWDGTDVQGSTVASGIYLYRLRMGEASETKKMMLLK